MTDSEYRSVDGVERRDRRFWWGLVGLGGVLMIASLIPWFRGARESYPHQHAQLILGGIITMLICSIGLAPQRAKWILLVATIVFLAGGFWFGWR